MFETLLGNGDLVSRQWMAVLCIGLVFFLVQMVLTLRFYFRMRRHERVLKRLNRDQERGGDGRKGADSAPNSFSWLRWVLSIFPTNTSHPPGNFTREEVLQELDSRIASNGDYLLLQRMGVMAPLMGVVLTVVGFYWLEVGDDDQSLQSILLAVTPLVGGVGTGAVLALINQGLLHVAGQRIEGLRMTARTWFDAVVWSHIGLDTQAATVKAVRAMERFAGSIGEAADKHDRNSQQINESTASMMDAAMRFREVVESFSTEIDGIPEALSDVRTSTTAAAGTLEELLEVGSRAVANLDVSVAAFRTTLDRDFAGAAKLHHHANQVLANSVQQFSETATQLKSGAEELKASAQANTAASSRLDASIRQHLVPGNQGFFEAVNDLSTRLGAFSHEVGTLSSHAKAVAGEFEKVSGGLGPSVTSFCEAIENRFGPAMSQQSTQAESVARSMQELREMAESMSQGTKTLNSLLQSLTQFVGESKATQQTLTEAANNLAAVGKQMRNSIESDVAPSQRTMHEAAESFAASAGQMSDFMEQGVGPATRELASLHETLTGLEDAVGAIQKFSNARGDIDRLAATLARAAEISDAIAALPEQMRHLIEQKIDHQGSVANSGGRLAAWFAKRPK